MTIIKIDDEIGYGYITAEQIIRQLTEATGDVRVVLDSPGGDVFEGIQIHNALRDYDRGSVHILINSLAASITSYIAMAGDTITVRSNSTMMIHNVWTVGIGDHRELRRTADIAEGLTGLLIYAYAARTGKSEEAIAKLLDEETYLFGEEITQGGFADEMETVEAPTDRMTAIALATQRFRACEAHVRNAARAPDEERMAALMAACAPAARADPAPDPTPPPAEPPALARSPGYTANRLKLIGAQI